MDVDIDFSGKLESLNHCLATVYVVLMLHMVSGKSAPMEHRKSVILKGTLHCSYRATEIAAVTVTAV